MNKKTFINLVILISILSVSFIPFQSVRSAPTITNVSGHITADTTWTSDNLYVVVDHITVDENITLTINEGTIIKFADNKLMAVNGKLRVIGTGNNPVHFTSLKDDTLGGDTNGDGSASAPQPGDWGHINFRENSVDAESIIQYTVIQYGGYFKAHQYEYYGCYYCSYPGAIRFEASSPTIKNNTILNNQGYALTGDVNSYPVVSKNIIRDNGGNGLEVREGTFSTDLPVTRNWRNTDIVYAVTGHVTIPAGITLVIEPGVIVKFGTNKLMGVNGVLKVSGIGDNLVNITSLKDDTLGGDTNGDGSASAPQPGDWGHINFRENSVDAESIIQYTVIQYGGYFKAHQYEYYGCYYCSYPGAIRFEASSPTIKNNTILNNQGYALTGDVNSYPVVSKNIIRDNGGNGLEVREGTFSTDLPVTRNWRNTDIVYAVTGHVTIPAGITLVIEPGVIVKFGTNKLMGVNGVLKVSGTGDNLVNITSLKDDTLGGDTNGDGSASAPQPGDWGHINFRENSVDAESIIQYAVIQYGGYFKAHQYEYYGCYYCSYPGAIRFEASSPTIKNNTILNNQGYALTGDVNSYPVVSKNIIRDNGGNGLEVREGTFSTDLPVTRNWRNTDIVYAVTGHVTIPVGITLVIEPGVIVKFGTNKLMGVNGVLEIKDPIRSVYENTRVDNFIDFSRYPFKVFLPMILKPTIKTPVIITSLKDDNHGGDTNGDGAASTPQPGDWGHIAFLDSSVDGKNFIENSILQYGGYFKAYQYEYYGCYYCTYSGVIRFDSASPTIRYNAIRNNEIGLYTKSSSQPLIVNNAIYNNNQFGLYNEDTSAYVKAENNWWGTSRGPYHTSNPFGIGNPVSDYVDFSPWLTSSPVSLR